MEEKKRKRPSPEEQPLSESLDFALWADEYQVLGLYRSLVVRGDTALHSLYLIREALKCWGREAVEKAIRAYSRQVVGTEPRFRKRPVSFFQPDIVEQFIEEPAEAPSGDPLKSLREALKKEAS